MVAANVVRDFHIGNTRILTHMNQLEAVGEEQYIKRQREMNCIDMEAPEPEE